MRSFKPQMGEQINLDEAARVPFENCCHWRCSSLPPTTFTLRLNESFTHQDQRQLPSCQTDVTSTDKQEHDGQTQQHQHAQHGGDQRVCREAA